MTETIIQTVVKENQDYTVLKILDKIGYEFEGNQIKNLEYYIVECKHCDYVQHGNSGDMVEHQVVMHDNTRIKFSNYLVTI